MQCRNCVFVCKGKVDKCSLGGYGGRGLDPYPADIECDIEPIRIDALERQSEGRLQQAKPTEQQRIDALNTELVAARRQVADLTGQLMSLKTSLLTLEDERNAQVDALRAHLREKDGHIANLDRLLSWQEGENGELFLPVQSDVEARLRRLEERIQVSLVGADVALAQRLDALESRVSRLEPVGSECAEASAHELSSALVKLLSVLPIREIDWEDGDKADASGWTWGEGQTRTEPAPPVVDRNGTELRVGDVVVCPLVNVRGTIGEITNAGNLLMSLDGGCNGWAVQWNPNTVVLWQRAEVAE